MIDLGLMHIASPYPSPCHQFAHTARRIAFLPRMTP